MLVTFAQGHQVRACDVVTLISISPSLGGFIRSFLPNLYKAVSKFSIPVPSTHYFIYTPNITLLISSTLSIMALLALVAVLASIYITVEIFTIVYNIFFHPLAQFPGPWWAGASYLHELYFDVIRGGQYHKQVEKMHQRYGREHIVRR